MQQLPILVVPAMTTAVEGEHYRLDQHTVLASGIKEDNTGSTLLIGSEAEELSITRGTLGGGS